LSRTPDGKIALKEAFAKSAVSHQFGPNPPVWPQEVLCSSYTTHVVQDCGMPSKSTTLVTTAEQAKALRICTETLRRWTRDGKVPCVRLSSRVVRYEPNAVLAALEAHANKESHDG